ncbi:hypothetical protein [Microbacterium sp. NPDC076911]|uniref:hypothetical protein n=1 Tax=Microbacterium sp. NPDC076911 TaxID=3154958 RepID=UPI00343855F8
MIHRFARIAAVGAVLASVLVGCAAQPEPAASPTVAFSNEEEAFAAAEATYRAYVDALNAVDLSDPETFEDVYAWTTGDESAQAREDLTSLHAEGFEVGGQTRVLSLQPSTEQPDDFPLSLILDVCLDVRGVTLLDNEGTSVVAPDRPDQQSLRVPLARSNSSSSDFRISTVGGREGISECAG